MGSLYKASGLRFDLESDLSSNNQQRKLIITFRLRYLAVLIVLQCLGGVACSFGEGSRSENGARATVVVLG